MFLITFQKKLCFLEPVVFMKRVKLLLIGIIFVLRIFCSVSSTTGHNHLKDSTMPIYMVDGESDFIKIVVIIGKFIVFFQLTYSYEGLMGDKSIIFQIGRYID